MILIVWFGIFPVSYSGIFSVISIMAPKRTTFKRKRRTVFKKRTFKKRPVRKGTKANRETVTYMVPRQMPFAPKYRTKMTIKFMSYILPAGLDGSGNGRAYIGLNYCYQPLNNITWQGIVGTGPFYINGTVTTGLQPLGFSQLCPSSGQFYRNYRVYSSKLSVSAAPQSPADYFEMAITPSRNTNVPNATDVAMAQPYTKSKVFWTGKTNANATDVLTNYMPVHRLAGVTSRSIQDDLSGNFTGNYAGVLPVTQYYWVVNISALSAVDTTANIMLTFEINYWLEFFNPSSGGFPIS